MSDGLPTVTHDARTGFYRVECDPAETRPFLALGAILEAIEDGESMSMPPLYDVIDCEALDRLVAWSNDGSRAESLAIEYVTDRLVLIVRCEDGTASLQVRPEP